MFAEAKCCKNSRKRKRNRTIVWTDRSSLKNKIFLELGKEKGEHLGKREKLGRDGNFSHGSSHAQRNAGRKVTVRIRTWALMTDMTCTCSRFLSQVRGGAG